MSDCLSIVFVELGRVAVERSISAGVGVRVGVCVHAGGRWNKVGVAFGSDRVGDFPYAHAASGIKNIKISMRFTMDTF